MNDSRRRDEEIFAAALALAPELRKQFIASEANGNDRLKQDVLSLLEHHEASEQFLEVPLVSAKDAATEQARRLLATGTVLGSYRIVEHIGEGGMADVYLAEQAAPVTRRVAVKVLKPGMDTRQILARMDQERQALALMNHPGIVSVFDAGTTKDSRPYFVMEHFEGRPITTFCDERSLSIDARLPLFLKVCGAVQHAHHRGIVHRDLKPSNILVADGAEPTPKVIDFGIAKALERPLIGRTLQTEIGMRIGTPGYMSPEQLGRSDTPVDTRADVYALGVLLHELLVGALPAKSFSAISTPGHHGTASGLSPSPSHTLAASPDSTDVATRRATDRRSLARKVRGDLDAIVLKALEEDPNRRYPTVAEVAAEIDRYLRKEPVLARTPTVGYRIARAAQRNSVLFSVFCALVGMLVIGFTVSSLLYVQGKRQRDNLFRLSDGVILTSVMAEAEELVPATPGNLRKMQRWLDGPARELIGRLELHHAVLYAMVKQAGAERIDEAAFEDPNQEFEFRLLRKLVERLEAFAAPDVGLYDRTRARARFAREVRARSIDLYRERWHETVIAIANPLVSPEYAGLALEPQLGLVPVGRDGDSGLSEFGHLETGEIPIREASTGRLILTEDTGLVFILIPAGTFQMGAVPPSPEGAQGANLDPTARSSEGPIHQVTLESPFFVSKYEMTEAQWKRVIGGDLDRRLPNRVFAGVVRSGSHPIDGVSWFEASRAMRYLGLHLPTEAQWEYATRGGTTTRWWTGNDPDALREIGNFADLSFQKATRSHHRRVRPWDDGFPYTAPVGIFDPNPFGVHDALGNVGEWVRDGNVGYDQPTRPQDGLRRADGEQRIFRGGAFENNNPTVSRRVFATGEKRWALGVRPVRAVDGFEVRDE